MSFRKLFTILAVMALLAGAGVAAAFASSPSHALSGGTTATGTTACTGQDDQGEVAQGDDESEAATEVDQAVAKVSQEAGSAQADDQQGDDQQGDDQGDNNECDG